MASGGGGKVVLVALLANLALAAFKYFAAYMSGSSSMLAEAHHSVADTLNQVLLLIGLSRARRGPSDRHPFGRGKEQFFWSFAVALVLFGGAGGLSIKGGLHKILHPEPLADPFWSYLAVGLGLFLDSIALRAALKELRAQMARTGETSLVRAFRECTDAVTITVLMEDALALVGLAVAGVGIALTQLTGNPAIDGAASVLIGVILMVFALLLALELKTLLIGEGLPPRMIAGLRRAVEQEAAVIRLHDLRTLILGKDEALVVVTAQFASELKVPELEAAVLRIEARLRGLVPGARCYIEAKASAPRA